MAYDTEPSRLYTFKSFPLYANNINPLTLAENGFYCTGRSDEVKCYKCGKTYKNWRNEKDLFNVHNTDGVPCRRNDIDNILPNINETTVDKLDKHIIDKDPQTLSKDVLIKENDRLKLICLNCKNQPRQYLYLPCRHLVHCTVCSDAMDNCVVCGKQILGSVRIYMS